MGSYLSEQIARDKARYERSQRESVTKNRTIRYVACSHCGADTQYVAGLTNQTCSRCWFR